MESRRINEGNQLKVNLSDWPGHITCTSALNICLINPPTLGTVYKLLWGLTSQAGSEQWTTCQTNGKEIQSEAQELGLNRSEKKTNTTGNQLDQAPSELTHKEEIKWALQNPLSWFLNELFTWFLSIIGMGLPVSIKRGDPGKIPGRGPLIKHVPV